MKKRILLIVLLSVTISTLCANRDDVSFGLRGGLYLTETKMEHPGFSTLVDIGYTHFWQTRARVDLGIHTGVNVGYQQCSYAQSYQDQFTNEDYLGYQMDYTVTAQEVKEVQQHISLEIPVQFAIFYRNWIFHVGPKLIFPVWNRYTQTLDNLQIECYYPATEVTIHSELITGKPSEALYQKTGNDYAPILSLAVGLDAGYEWKLQRLNRVGVGVFVDCVPYTLYRETPSASNKLVTVDPITDSDYPPASVNLYPLSSSISNKYAFSVGIRLYYAMDFKTRW